jgi:flagellar FliJ protein
MSFQFPLQKVLDIKGKEKDQAQLDYHLSVKKKTELQETMIALINKRDTEQARLLDASLQGHRASDMLVHHRYISHLDQQILQVQVNLGGMEREVESKKFILAEKFKVQSTWQEWKDKATQAYNENAAKYEQAQMDEMATIRYFRSQH